MEVHLWSTFGQLLVKFLLLKVASHVGADQVRSLRDRLAFATATAFSFLDVSSGNECCASYASA